MRETLAALADIHYGSSPNGVSAVDGSFPIYGTGGVYGKATRSLFPAGIVVARKGSLGSPHLVKQPFWPVDTTYAVIPKKNIDIEWLYFCLLNFDLTKLNEATGVPSISRSWLSKIEFLNPGAEKQKYIAACLASIDTAIERTEALITKHQQIKAGLMQDLFTRGVQPNGQLRPPRSEAPGLYQETALGWLPREWSVSDCGREFAIDSGITLGPHRRPGRNARPYLRVANVHRDELRLEDLAHLEELAGDSDLSLKEKDLLVVEGHANRMEIGRCAMITAAAVGMLFQNHLFRLRPQRLISEFALDWLNSHHAQRYWDMTCSTSSGLNTINRKMLGRLPVHVPPVDEQARIVRASSGAKCRIEEEAQLLAKLRRQKLGLMQDLLSGRVSVDHLVPELASA
ncbi:restriction endonuclease subunit S [Aquabacterium sp.]|uniref:restriction endonuclease subunit S n=1 Tax=Aquabacterium sp. TaxID=1872578 RepID=UPI0035B0F733